MGIRPNLPQFSLLVLVNAFVGAMVGMERSILPLMGEREFGIASRSAIISFLITFGIVKALSNLVAGRFSDRVGRRKILIAGWIAGIPVPFLLMGAQSWSWILAANVLLGLNQGLCWSTTVIMKIDLAGPRRRGFAMGLNEFSGYVAVAVAAFCSALIAQKYGLRPYPFFLGVGVSITGFLLSFLFVKETSGFTKVESGLSGRPREETAEEAISFKEVFLRTSWQDRNLFSCSQAGLINNLNDGVAWGLFPIYFASLGFPVAEIGILAAVYPGVWGVTQVFTGILSDNIGRKWMIAAGMWLQAAAIWMILGAGEFAWLLGASALLGLGTALAYPTLLAAVGDSSKPAWRASAVGVYRLWRDLGYAAGAICIGFAADTLGLSPAFRIVACLTFVSGVIVAAAYREPSGSG
ncbi:MAG TPA: MFS transporter [Bacteroidota bacterium]|jgi:MFS family permease